MEFVPDETLKSYRRRKRMKKLKFGAITLVLILVIMAGIGGLHSVLAAEKVELSWVHCFGGPGRAAAFKEACARFEQLNPNISVTWSEVPWPTFFDKLTTQIVAKKVPSIVYFWAVQAPKFIKYDALLNVEPYMRRDNVDPSDYFQAPIIAMSGPEGTGIYGLPYDVNVHVLAYNADMFDATGLSYPDGNWLWSDLLAAAKKLTKDGQWGFEEMTAGHSREAYTIGNQATFFTKDGQTFIGDSAKMKETLQWWTDLITKYKVAVPGATGKGMPGGAFIAGKSGMGFSSQGALLTQVRSVPFNYGVVPFPMKEKEFPKIGFAPSGILAPTSEAAGNPYPEETWQLLKHLESEEIQSYWAKMIPSFPGHKGAVDSFVSAVSEGDPDNNVPTNMVAFKTAAEVGVPHSGTGKTTGFYEMDRIMTAALEALWISQSLDVDGATAQMRERIDAVYEKEAAIWD